MVSYYMLSQEQQIFEQIKKAKRILITFSKQWNGDAVASALALYLFLVKMEKDAEIVAEKSEHGRQFSFLPGYGEIGHRLDNLRNFIISLDITNAKVGQIKYQMEKNLLNFIISPKEGFFSHEDIKSQSSGFKYDLIIALDTPDLESLGGIYDNDTEFFYQVPIIDIDHHSDNEEFGQINLIELTAISTTEILFNLMSRYQRDYIDQNIATCLLAGIISETRSFKTQNITPQALAISSELISMGARREEIVNRLYRSRPLSVLKLWGRVLARLTGSLDNKLVWTSLSLLDFAKTETDENDVAEVIDELIVSIPEAKIIVIFYEKNGKPPSAHKDDKVSLADSGPGVTTRAMVYSVKNINSLQLVKKWNPTGTKYLARISLDKGIKEAETELIGYIRETLEKLSL